MENPHNDNAVGFDAVVDGMASITAAAVALTDVIAGHTRFRPICELFHRIEHLVTIAVRLFKPPFLKGVEPD